MAKGTSYGNSRQIRLSTHLLSERISRKYLSSIILSKWGIKSVFDGVDELKYIKTWQVLQSMVFVNSMSQKRISHRQDMRERSYFGSVCKEFESEECGESKSCKFNVFAWCSHLTSYLGNKTSVYHTSWCVILIGWDYFDDISIDGCAHWNIEFHFHLTLSSIYLSCPRNTTHQKFWWDGIYKSTCEWVEFDLEHYKKFVS